MVFTAQTRKCKRVKEGLNPNRLVSSFINTYRRGFCLIKFCLHLASNIIASQALVNSLCHGVAVRCFTCASRARPRLCGEASVGPAAAGTCLWGAGALLLGCPLPLRPSQTDNVLPNPTLSPELTWEKGPRGNVYTPFPFSDYFCSVIFSSWLVAQAQLVLRLPK